MIKNILISCIVLLISNEGFGQSGFYVGVSGTYSFIPNTEMVESILLPNPLYSSTQIRVSESFDVKPGANIGVGYNKVLIERFSISAGVGTSFHRYQRKLKVNMPENSTTNLDRGDDMPVGDFYYSAQPVGIHYEDMEEPIDNTAIIDNSNDGKTKILYLDVPVKIHYSLVPEKFKIGIGVKNNFIVYSSQIKSLFDYSDPYHPTQIEYNDKSGDGLRSYQLNGSFSLEYRVFKAVWLQTSYDQGLLSIYDRDKLTPTNRTAQYRTVELGLKYEL